MIKIQKVKIHNYRKFNEFSFEANESINILVGNNESGKSTILEAIDLVLSGSLRKLESIGLSNLFCIQAINNFLALPIEDKRIENLPNMYIEIYLNVDDNNLKLDYEGKNNSEKRICCGVRLTCKPNEEYAEEISNIIQNNDSCYFPYEYYTCVFDTFAAQQYNKKKSRMKLMWINTLNMNSSYAISEYIKKMYSNYTDNEAEIKLKLVNEINSLKLEYNNDVMDVLNKKLPQDEEYLFGLQSNTSVDFSQELTLINKNDKISLFNHGTGEQIITNTKFSINNKDMNVLLIEEPENHLSYVLLRQMISLIQQKSENQIFITTHSSMICTCLSLDKLIILSKETISQPLTTQLLDKETNEYFMKAPVVDILRIVLSNKVVLVEGPSEFILFDKFYKKVTKHSYFDDKISVLDIRGLSFKRYLDIIKILKTKVAVVTDNDYYSNSRIDSLKEYEVCDNIKIFTEKDPNLNTFEVVLYNKNKSMLDKIGISQEDMLNNKTDMAFKMLNDDYDIEVPDYIKEAIEWIKK